MKKKKRSTLHASSIEELKKQAEETEAKLAKLMIERYTSQPKNTREIKNIKHSLSIIKTILREKQLLKESTHEQKQ